MFTLLLSEFLLLVVVVEKTFSAFAFAFAFAARDDFEGAGKTLLMVSLCLRFRRNDALQFEGRENEMQRQQHGFVVITCCVMFKYY